MKVNRKDFATGAVFIAFGAFYGSVAFRTLPMGSALDMGPGYFPIILSGLMILIGTVIGVSSLIVPQESHFGLVPWRAVIMLSLSTILFASLVRQLGMLPGIFLTVLVACLATRQVKLFAAATISGSIALFCTVVFGYAIKVPIPIFGTWLGGQGGAF